jgi:hypothetical protein
LQIFARNSDQLERLRQISREIFGREKLVN